MSGSTFRDNTAHEWDDGVTVQITAGEFKNILNIASSFEAHPYNLVTNNCTNFVQETAHAAGININNSEGTIPVFTSYPAVPWGMKFVSALNPASMGQSLRQENVSYYYSGVIADYMWQPLRNHK